MDRKIPIETIYVTLVFITFIGIISFVFFQKRVHEYGPTISNDQVQIEELDRNNNEIPDTLKLDFTVISSHEMIVWGGLEICLSNKHKILRNCLNISYNYDLPGTDASGHSVFKRGQSKFTRYLFIREIDNFTVDKIRIKAIGENAPIMQRFIDIDDFNVNSMESVPFGTVEEGYPQYINVNSPIN